MKTLTYGQGCPDPYPTTCATVAGTEGNGWDNAALRGDASLVEKAEVLPHPGTGSGCRFPQHGQISTS